MKNGRLLILVIFLFSLGFSTVQGVQGQTGPDKQELSQEYTQRTVINGFRNLLETKIREVGQKIASIFIEQVKPDRSLFNPGNSELILEQVGGTGNWIGASGTFYDEEDNILYLYARYRDSFSRGYKAAIWNTTDGENFQRIWSLEKDELEALSLEGADIGREETGNYILYLSYQDAESGNWELITAEAEEPSSFDIEKSRKLQFESDYTHLKDPVLNDGLLYVYASKWHFMSSDTIAFNISNDVSETGRIDFGRDEKLSPRLTSILDLGDKELTFYDWRPSYFHVTEERSRYGYLNGSSLQTLMEPDRSLVSQEGTGALRYVSAETVGDEVWFFYEMAEDNGGHQLYLNKVRRQKVLNALERK